MRTYVIRQGDYLTRLGARMGFDPKKVWDHPRNAELKERRKSWEVLAPGDVLFIPDDAAPAPLRLLKGIQASFVATVPRVEIKLQYQGENGPLANEPYWIDGLPESTSGTTDGEGTVQVKVSVLVTEFTITFPKLAMRQSVRVGYLDPSDESGGIVQRLAHLGYLGFRDATGPEPGEEQCREAVRAFQHDAGLPETGILDKATVEALQTKHGDGA